MYTLSQYIRIKIIRILGKCKNAKAINALIVTLGHWNPNVQKEARDALVKIGSPALYGLIAALKHRNSNVRANVRDALNKIDSAWPNSKAAKKQVPEFIAALKYWYHYDQREVVKVLGEIWGVYPVDGLIAALRDTNFNVRTNARDALNKINSAWPKSEAARKQIPEFIDELRYGNSDVRKEAAKVLGEIGEARVVAELIAALRDWDSDVQKEASDALVKIGSPALYGLIAALRDTNSNVQTNARDALNKIDSAWPNSKAAKKQVPEFIVALRDDYSDVRKNARDSLDKIDSTWPKSEAAKKQIPDFIAALRNTNSDVRTIARNTLDKIDSTWPKSEAAKKQIPDFIAALRNTNSDVRTIARNALDKIDSTWPKSEAAKKQILDFIAVLKDRSSDIREEVVRILGEIGDSSALNGLLAVLMDWDSDVRKNARDALDKIDSTWPKSEAAKKQIPDFIAALRNTNSDVRTIARDALDKIDSTWPKSEAAKKQVSEFIAALKYRKDRGSDVRKDVVKVLGKIGDSSAVDGLLVALRDWDSDIRKEVIKALVEIGDVRAADGLITAAMMYSHYSYLDSQSEVAKALIEIGGARAIDRLIEALQDQHVRENAGRTLKKINELQSPLLSSYPFLFCTKCFLRSEKKKAKVGLMKNFSYVFCRGCNSSLHLIKDVKEVIGFIGDEGEDYKIDGERVYTKLWSEAEKKGRNADIDILEIRNSQSINYDYAINAVLNTLVNDISRPRDYIKNIPVVLKGNIPISENSRHLLNHEFGGINYPF